MPKLKNDALRDDKVAAGRRRLHIKVEARQGLRHYRLRRG